MLMCTEVRYLNNTYVYYRNLVIQKPVFLNLITYNMVEHNNFHKDKNLGILSTSIKYKVCLPLMDYGC